MANVSDTLRFELPDYGKPISKSEFDRLISVSISAQQVNDDIYYYNYKDHLIAKVDFTNNKVVYKKYESR